MEGGWEKSDLHVIQMMNMDDCSVHALHFVESGGGTETRISDRKGILTTSSGF